MDKGRYYRKGERAAARPFHPEVGTRQNMCDTCLGGIVVVLFFVLITVVILVTILWELVSVVVVVARVVSLAVVFSFVGAA